jgi:Rrf2 family protein
MRTLSKKTQYTLRAMYALSRHFGEGPMLISDLAEQESIPKKFLEQILLKLKSGGFVLSKKGKGGGYSLAQAPETITVGQVIRLVDGPLAPLPCASETAYRKCDECVDDRFCETKLVMRQVRDATAQILDRTSLADLVRWSDTARSEAEQQDAGAVMYYI